jgi:hypothetical protein
MTSEITVYNPVKGVWVPLRRWMRWCWDYNTTELHLTDEKWEDILP